MTSQDEFENMEFLEQENELEIDEVLAKLSQKIDNEREK